MYVIPDRLLREMYTGYFFFQAEDGIRDRSPSRGLGDVYKRQGMECPCTVTEGLTESQ